MKKTIPFILWIMLLFVALPMHQTQVNAATDSTPTIIVDQATGAAGDTVTVDVRFVNSPGIVSMKVKVGYDATALQLTDYRAADLTQNIHWGPSTKNPFIINWNDSVSPNVTGDKTLARLTFKILDDVTEGTSTPITLTYYSEDVHDSTFSNVPFAVQNGAVNVAQRTTGISLNTQTLAIKNGDTAALTATVSPTNAYNKAVTWSSSDPAVATVDANGVVTGIKKGTATITATTANGGYTATCSVDVSCDHIYKTTEIKATFEADGTILKQCSLCSHVAVNEVIKQVKTVSLAATAYGYNGSVRTPDVTVKNSDGEALTKDVDYTVSYADGRKNVGTYTVTVTMIGNYSGTKTLSFKINPIDISKCTLSLSSTSYTYDGKMKMPSVTVKNAGGTKLTENTHYTVAIDDVCVNVGTYSVAVTMKGNYTGTKTLTFKINPVDISKCSPSLSATSYTYDGTIKTPRVTVKDASGNILLEEFDYTAEYDDLCINAGTYKVTVTMVGNYTGTKTLTFKINPINISTCSPSLSATSYTYDGKVKAPRVTVKDASGTVLLEEFDYTVTYASGRKNAGTYKVTVNMIGNYTGTKTLTFKINPISVSKCTMALSTTTYTYNGAVKTPAVTVKNASGTTLTKNTDYTVTYADGRKNAGTYKVTVTMKGNYSGTKTLTFKINPINVSKCTMKLSTTTYTYDGKVKSPSVTVKNANGTTLTKGTHYTVTYASGRKTVGTYKVTVTMKGNYTGTKTLTFKINPPKTTVAKLTPTKTTMTVYVSRKSATAATGYQIQYATNKSFTDAKTKWITKYSTGSATLTGLKTKTTYFVRVRTYKKVGSTTYYSGWSTIAYKKTK